jgi:hypothetical protein
MEFATVLSKIQRSVGFTGLSSSLIYVMLKMVPADNDKQLHRHTWHITNDIIKAV